MEPTRSSSRSPEAKKMLAKKSEIGSERVQQLETRRCVQPSYLSVVDEADSNSGIGKSMEYLVT